MALGTNRVAAHASPGMAAAATARPASGGRNVATVSRDSIEDAGFSTHVGINDNSLLRYDDELAFDTSPDHGYRQHHNTPFVFRMAFGFQVEEAEEVLDKRAGSEERPFLTALMMGVGAYEQTMRITTPGSVKPGSVLNYMY